MARPQHRRDHINEHRTRIALAMITGLLAGTTRALIDWVRDYLTIGC
ncbi:hypothetical protein [Actinoplanes lobatus]|uniref:Uncharacterized protein n=1 Tax=Actinoplanes lobatus TaxID=113568 RepID=A0A7W7HKX1_9ACTN|nr:hypothetical protein [Actinoplanes lobatus]MBB4752396.1 hypothetical protein [Actinoplanes lobatus]